MTLAAAILRSCQKLQIRWTKRIDMAFGQAAKQGEIDPERDEFTSSFLHTSPPPDVSWRRGRPGRG